MSVCYIVGAGEFYGEFTKRDADLVIAADGGYDTLLSLGITPDLILGDMDSVRSVAENIERLVFPVRKDETDSFLAYREGARRGYTDFKLYGCVGGREDHTLANYALLVYARERGHKITLIGKCSEAFALVNESVTLSGEELSHLSVFAFGGEARGVSIRGAEYEAEGITLTPSYPLGVSNRFLGGDVTLEVKDGTLLVILEKNT